MSTDALIISINLDDSEVGGTLNKLEVQSNKTAKEIEKAFQPKTMFAKMFDQISLLQAGLGSLLLYKPGIDGLVKSFSSISSVISELSRVGADITKVFFGNIKNVFGLTTALGALSIGFIAFGDAVKHSNNEFIRMSGVFATFLGILTGSFAAALSLAIIKVGEWSTILGTKLVGSFQKVSDSFIKTEKNLAIFNATIINFDRVTSGSVGTVETWTNYIADLSEQFNLSSDALRKASIEIVSVGTKLGLQEDQLKDLLKVTAEYAKINQKDVFDSSVAFAAALAGNTQGILQYGVKLNEASNQQFLYKKGLDQSFDSLSDNEKTQVRFNNLLSQYAMVAGLGTAAAGTLADQQERLTNNIESLNTKLGEGAALIENNNLLASAYNLVLNNLNDTAIKVAGFFGALGARILQIGGFFLEWSFKIFAVVKILKVLNILLATDLTQSAFAKSLPIIGQSFNQIISNISGVNTKLNSTSNLFKISISSIGNVLNTFSKFLFGVSSNALTFSAAIKGLFITLGKGFAILIPYLKVFLITIGPIAVKLGLIVGAFVLLKKAFETVEERTQAFSQTMAILSGIFKEITSGVNVFTKAFDNIKVVLVEVGKRIILFVATVLTGLIGAFTAIARTNPFGVFSKKSIEAISLLDNKLQKFNSDMIASGFGDFGEAAFASTQKFNKAISEVNLQQLAQLKTALDDVGKTDLVKLSEEYAERLKLLQNARAQELLTEQQFLFYKNQAMLDFNTRQQEILDRINAEQIANAKRVKEQLIDAINGGITQVLSQSMQTLGAALVNGSGAFKDFGKIILGILGDLAIQMGTIIMAMGVAALKLAASLSNPATAGLAIAAGAALVALGGAFKALAGGKGGFQAIPDANAGGGGINTSPESDFPDSSTIIKDNNRVVVNVEGTVLDPRGVGIQIAEILQETFGSNGVTVTA